MHKLVVYNSPRKLMAITVSFLLLAVILIALSLTRYSHPAITVISALIALVLVAGAWNTLSRLKGHKPLFTFDEDGVTDHTKAGDVITIPWGQVIGVQLKAANSNDLMLDVYGFKTRDQLDVVTESMEEQLKATGSDKVYYNLELSGLWVNRSGIREAFDWIRTNVGDRDGQIVYADFKDPMAKLGENRFMKRRFRNPFARKGGR